ncbi:hypothetical protein ABC382_00740 [Lysinibacillus sp. 1P01SD]|uniref:hypothetical protein n=1 Tax=Lysinibacillus sp. 1P01SD TaxID=3132285 RepID=UPI0039A3B9AF
MTMKFFGLQYKKSYFYDFEKLDDVTVATSSCLLPTLQFAMDERKAIGDEYDVVEIVIERVSEDGFSYRVNEIDDYEKKEQIEQPNSYVERELELFFMKNALMLNKYKVTIKVDKHELDIYETDFESAQDKCFLYIKVSPTSYDYPFKEKIFYILTDILDGKRVLFISTEECSEQGTAIYRRKLTDLFSMDTLKKINELVDNIQSNIELKNKNALVDLRGVDIVIQRKHLLKHFKDVMQNFIEHSLREGTGYSTTTSHNFKGWE